MAKKIIDVSENNGKIRWDSVKGKVDGVIIRCGYGQDKTSQDDSRFVENVEGCLKYGIPFGLYFYSYATNLDKVDGEIAHCLRLVSPYKDSISFPIFYDVEEVSIVNDISSKCNKFIDGMAAHGFKAGIYSMEYWWLNYLTGVKKCPKWVACWGSQGPDVDDYILWQYTSRDSVPGIDGDVDASWYYGEIFNIKTNKTVDELAAEVLAGEWGNGDERKNRLEAAGYNYNDVQNRVNEILDIKQPASISEIAQEVIDGKWGNGDERKKKLEEAGYNYEEVQNRVNYILKINDRLYYEIQPGDTLSSIADKYETTYTKLAELNGISNPDKIYAGDRIRVR